MNNEIHTKCNGNGRKSVKEPVSMSIKRAISELAVNEWKNEAKKAVNQNCSRWRKIRLCTVPEFLGRWKRRWQWRTDRSSDGDGDDDERVFGLRLSAKCVNFICIDTQILKRCSTVVTCK